MSVFHGQVDEQAGVCRREALVHERVGGVRQPLIGSFRRDVAEY